MLIVLTTPWFVARLGLEGYGLIGLWLVATYVTLIFDFGLGTTCAREMALALGRRADSHEFEALLRLFERLLLLIAVLVFMLAWLAAPWIATAWLNVKGLSGGELSRLLQWMSLSIAAQLVVAFYGLALGGLQRQELMNGLQALNNGLRYLGGALILALGGAILEFFVFQAVASTLVAVLSRRAVMKQLNPGAPAPDGLPKPVLRDHLRFSGGMFATALLAAGVSNADRLFVSKLLAAEMLGRYTIAATVIGILQMFIVAFHRVYQPKFAELTASGDAQGLRRAYYQACMTVGAAIIPMSVLFVTYANEVFRLWVGWTDPATTLVSRLLVIGYAMAGLMWLPASYQQAIGWTRLNVGLMVLAWLVGMPTLWWCIRLYGLPGAAAMMLVHGTIQLTIGLGLMNRVCFPGESWLWIRRVVVVPLLLSVPTAALLHWLLPARPSLAVTVLWMVATTGVIAALSYHGRGRITAVESTQPARQSP